MDIASHVQYLLGRNEWTLKTLSDKTGLSVSYLSDIQRGRTIPTLYTLEKIAAAFEMSVVVFLGGADLGLSNDEQWLLDAYRAGNMVEILRLLVNNADGVDQIKPITDENGDIVEIPF